MKEHSILKKVVQVIFIVSLPFFTLMELHSGAGGLGYAVSLVLALLVAVGISRIMTESLFEESNGAYLIVAAVAAAYISYCYAWQGNGVCIMNMYPQLLELFPVRVTSNRLAAGLMLAAFPAIFMLVCWVIKKAWRYILQFVKSFDKFEKIYLALLGVAAVAAIAFLYFGTGLFYCGKIGDIPQMYDILYTTDSTEVYLTDSFLRILSGPNDIRQPLFGVFALPVALIGKLVSAVLFFVPDSYAMVLGVEQILLEGVTVVMLARLLKVEGKERIAFTLFMTCSYAYLIHGLMLEQYVIAYFYVILTIYVYKTSDRTNYAYFGAVSTLLTSGILFGLLTKAREAKQWCKDVFQCFVCYLGIVIICGQLPQFLGMKDKLQRLMSFSGEKVSWTEKWVQFTHFVRDIFWAPAGQAQNGNFPSYRVVEPEGIAWFGVLLLVLVLCGFLVSYREWISKIAMFWVLFSVLILVVIGWGTAENGLILYALYFAWAYLVLIYQFLRRVLKQPAVRTVVIGGIALSMAVWNICELVRIYEFGMTYYPTL